MKSSERMHVSWHRVTPVAAALLLALAISVYIQRPVEAERLEVPPVPTDIRVADGNKVYLQGHAVGTQNYMCLPSGAGFAWTLLGPQATLFADNGKQVMTHFLSPNPDEAGTARATWMHSHDSSTVWAMASGTSSDPAFVEAGAIPWLRLAVVGSEDGTQGSERLAETTFIQRLNTSGGAAPTTGCTSLSDVGKRAFVPYTADYFFYKAS